MGGCNLSDVSVTELDRCLGSSYLHHFPDSPFMCSGMAHYGTSLNSHALSFYAKGCAITTITERHFSLFYSSKQFDYIYWPAPAGRRFAAQIIHPNQDGNKCYGKINSHA
jgi:hypothetical protein